MSREEKFNCDCGCGSYTLKSWDSGWFELSQFGDPSDTSEPKLKHRLHFKNLECQLRWATRASKIIPELQKAARNVSPRGSFSSDKLPGVYI